MTAGQRGAMEASNASGGTTSAASIEADLCADGSGFIPMELQTGPPWNEEPGRGFPGDRRSRERFASPEPSTTKG